MANTPAWFIEDDYLASKLAQLIASGETEYETTEQVKEAIEAEGFTTFEHFEKFGGEEQTSPNAYFDVAYYLQAKADQLNNHPDEDRDDWTAEEVAEAIAAEGLTPWSHFQAWGWKEGVNPSDDFNLDAYFADKLQQLIDEGEDYTTVKQVKAAFAEAGIDPVAHYYAYGADEGLTPKSAREAELEELTEAVEGYQEAVENRLDFLKEAAENDDVAAKIKSNAGDPEDPDDIVQAIEDLLGDAKVELNVASPTYNNYDTADDDVIPAMIAADEKTLASNLAAEETAVAAVKGLKTAINAAITANARYQQAFEANGEAQTEFTGEVGRFDAVNDGDLDGMANVLDPFNEGDPVLTFDNGVDPAYPVIEMGANGKLKVADDVTLDGIDALLATAQGYRDAAELLGDRNEVLQKAIARVIDVENGNVVPTDPDTIDVDDSRDVDGNLTFAGEADIEIAADYMTAKNALAAFAEAVADFNEINELMTALEAHDDAREAAADAIEELGYNLVEFDGGLAEGTENDDVFIYTGEDGTIDLFGEVGDDVLFIGTEYTFNDDIENGDAAVLEVFFTQDGDDVIVTIEQVPFGSNAEFPEVDEIILTGMTVESLTFEQGYVQLVG